MKIRTQEINLTRLVEDFLRSYFKENLDEVEILKQVEQKKLELAVLEKKRENLEKDKEKKKKLDYYMNLFIGKREGTQEFMIRKEYKLAVQYGYNKSWEDFCREIGRGDLVDGK